MHTRRIPIRFLSTVGLAGLLLSGWFAVAWGQTVPAERVTFTTGDGVELVADYYAAAGEGVKPPVVILLPMYQLDRSTYQPLAPALRQAGIAALALDVRGHGESVGPAEMNLPGRVKQRDKAVFAAMYRDVAAAYCWLAELQQVDLTRLGLVGASVGCSVALDYAGRDRSVDAVVCLTPGMDYLGLDSKRHVQKVQGRAILLLASEDEREAADQLGELNAQATVKIFEQEATQPGELHGTRMFGRVPGVEAVIVKFLTDNLGVGGEDPVAASMHPGARVYYPQGSAAIKRLKPENVRWFSSAAEAEARGLKPSKSSARPAGQEQPQEPEP